MSMDFVIGRWRLDAVRETLEGEEGPAPVGTRGLALLRALAQANGAVVSKAALLDAAWPGLTVEESNLTVQISRLRRCLGDHVIATVPRRGYRLTVAALPVAALPVAALPVAGDEQNREPTIAVLSEDDDPDHYFAGGMVREVILALTRYPGPRVIAANSSRHFRGEPALDRAVAELGIRYALVVAVQRVGERVRVSARLIEAATRAYIWADRYDRDLTDVFAVHDEIAEHIAAVLVARVVRAERVRTMRKPLESLVAYDWYLRATDDSRTWHGEDFLAAQRGLEQALLLAPGFPPALAALALHRVSSWVEPKGRPDWRSWNDRTLLEQAVEAARAALEGDPLLPQAHLALAFALFWLHRREQSADAALRLRALNPGFVDGRLGFMLTIDGHPEEGLAMLRRVERVDPFHTPMLLGWVGATLLLLDQAEAALDALRDCTARAPLWRLGHLWRAAASWRLGLPAEARAEAETVMRIDPGFTVGAWWWLHQFRDVARARRVADDLIEAGVPAGDISVRWAARQPDPRHRFDYQAMKALNDDIQMRSDWFIPLCTGPERLRNQHRLKLHPTQKPEALLHRVMLASTSPEDIVLDPFIGTGTTGVVAKRRHRHFIGIERHPAYAEAAIGRIRHTQRVSADGIATAPSKRDAPRVPFGSLVEQGLLPAGTRLHDRQRRVTAVVVVAADGSVVAGGVRGSIHKAGATVTNAPSCNGRTFWHFERDGALVPLDMLRETRAGV